MGPMETALALIRLGAVSQRVESHSKRGRETPIELDLLTAFSASPKLVTELEMTVPSSWTYSTPLRADLVGTSDLREPNVELKVWSGTSRRTNKITLEERGQFQYMVDGAADGADLVLITPRRRVETHKAYFRKDPWRIKTLYDVAEACEVAMREPDVAEALGEMGPRVREAVAAQALRSANLI